MNIAFAVIGLAVAAIGLYFGPKSEVSPPRLSAGSLVALFATLGLAYGVGVAYAKGMPGLTEAAVAALAAAVVGVICAACEGKGGFAVPAGLGLVLAAACTAMPFETRHLNQLGMLVGLGVAAVFVGQRSVNLAVCSAVAAAVAVCDYLSAPAGTSTFAGSALGVVIAVGCLISQFGKSDLVRALIALAAMAAGAFLLKGGVLQGTDLGYLFLTGALVGGVAHMLMDEEATSAKTLVCVVLWLGLATIGFSFGRGAGIAAALIGGLGVPIAFGNSRAVATAAPLIGIALYRMFRERYSTASDAVDIGQHYAMIGVILGIALPQLVQSWVAGRPGDDAKVAVAKVAWNVVLFAVPALTMMILGSNGLIGLATGLAFAAVVPTLHREASNVALPLSIGLAALVPLGFDWFQKLADLTRDEKLKMLVWIGVAGAVAALLIIVLSPKAQTTDNRS